jgi:hypothetical protein
MTRQVMEVNAATGTEIVRDMTSEEIADLEAQNAKYLADKTAQEDTLKAAEDSLLQATGISREQAELLGLVRKPATIKSGTLD